MNTVELWKSNFGSDYTNRNNGQNVGSRLAVWKSILPRGIKSILEVGANVGANLEAISQISDANLFACEPNDHARQHLTGLCSIVLKDTADSIGLPDKYADLVFTSGVLIHVPPNRLEASMREIHRVSSKYIICGEYFAPSEEMIPYRGHMNALWRRDYGSLYMGLFPNLKCIDVKFAWKRTTGLDNVTFWIFEK